MPNYNTTTHDTWTVKDLLDSYNDQIKNRKYVLKLPEFQRGIVWNNNQKRELIESIQKNMPIGSLLLYKENDTYQLVDGLQRTTAILEYVVAPMKFLTKNNENFDKIVKKYKEVLSNIGQDVSEENLSRIIFEWLQSVQSFGLNDYTPNILLKYIVDNGIIINNPDYNLIQELTTGDIPTLFENIKAESDIKDKTIPIIIYTGDNLPEVFELINRTGTKLNKFDVFAATWYKKEYLHLDIEDEGIKKAIADKYKEVEKLGFNIADEDEDYSFYEFFFGFGKHLSEEYSDLFKSSSDKSMAESIGFNLPALCLGLTLKQVKDLPRIILNRNIDINDLARKIKESVEVVNSALSPITGLKANSKKTKNTSPITAKYSEYQLLSFIVKVFMSKYDTRLNPKTDKQSEDDLEKLRNNIPYHFLYDIIDGRWDGSVDSVANAIVKPENRQYFETISKDRWDKQLAVYFDKELKNETKKRDTNPSVAVLFLKYIYSKIVTVHENATREYHLEHLTPYGRFKDKNESWAINAVSNFCLLEKDLNLSKGKKTIYEFFDDREKSNCLIKDENELKDIEKRCTFTSREDLQFIEKDDSFTRENYEKFLRERFDKLKTLFYKLNGIN